MTGIAVALPGIAMIGSMLQSAYAQVIAHHLVPQDAHCRHPRQLHRVQYRNRHCKIDHGHLIVARHLA